ncbi:sugar-transfer associated ATP-grasp domain-containing protein [Vagococcus fluvialis]|uniref:sugar-transfer associated ATP-grasp domain-containing protein n=1 Tax=Vagococcus fluvialis TaxID=2738 RepID=UPI003D0ED67D
MSKLETLESDFDNLVIQRILKQLKYLVPIHESSLNTVKVLTINLDGKIQVVSSVVRMGVGDSRIDNCGSGGFVSGINKNGCMKNVCTMVMENILTFILKGMILEEGKCRHLKK